VRNAQMSRFAVLHWTFLLGSTLMPRAHEDKRFYFAKDELSS
jgi:hypothetical protein